MTHVIRLRGPWDSERVPPGAQPDGTSPSIWRYVRRFGCPTGLGPSERVWLVFEGALPASVRLNDQPLGEIGAAPSSDRFEITSLLAERNRVTIEIAMLAARAPQENLAAETGVGSAGGPIGEVRLEIESTLDSEN